MEECLLYTLELCCNGKMDKNNESINHHHLMLNDKCAVYDIGANNNFIFNMKTNYLLNVSQRLRVPAQLLPLLLMVEAGVRARLGINLCR